MEKTINEKIQAIVNAYQSGMRKKQIDPIGSGSSMETILSGGRPTDRKIEQMYANVIVHQEKELSRNQFKIKINGNANLSRQEKEQILLEAIKNGIARSRLDIKSKGASANRLRLGRRVHGKTINEMYDNLLSFLGYRSSQQRPATGEHFLNEKVRTLEILVSTLLEQVKSLNAQMQTLQTQQQSLAHLPQPQKKTRKILGVTIVQKTDKVRGKSYKRWYGVHKLNGKRRWIYIGNNLALAQQKISAALLGGQV